MTDAAVSTTEPPSLPGEVVAPTPGPSPSRHPTADPLQDPANQLDLVRSEAAAERQARRTPRRPYSRSATPATGTSSPNETGQSSCSRVCWKPEIVLWTSLRRRSCQR